MAAKLLVDGVLVDAPEGIAEAAAALPAGPAAPVPAEVTNWQARAVLRRTFLPDVPDVSLFTRTDTTLRRARDETAGLPESDPARMRADLYWQAWEQANTFQRHGGLLATFAAGFGLTDADVDDMFRAAAAETV